MWIPLIIIIIIIVILIPLYNKSQDNSNASNNSKLSEEEAYNNVMDAFHDLENAFVELENDQIIYMKDDVKALLTYSYYANFYMPILLSCFSEMFDIASNPKESKIHFLKEIISANPFFYIHNNEKHYVGTYNNAFQSGKLIQEIYDLGNIFSDSYVWTYAFANMFDYMDYEEKTEPKQNIWYSSGRLNIETILKDFNFIGTNLPIKDFSYQIQYLSKLDNKCREYHQKLNKDQIYELTSDQRIDKASIEYISSL